MPQDLDIFAGLGSESEKDWPTVSATQADVPAIDRLTPGSALHEKTLTYLLDRLKISEDEMSKFHPRWEAGERRSQAYINLTDWDKRLKELNESSAPPEVVNVVVPYSFATQATVVTYLVHTFCGRKPILQVGSYKAETMKSAQNMEQVLQYNADHMRLIKHLFQFFQDGEQYGLSVLRTRWKTEKSQRTVWKTGIKYGFMNIPIGMESQKVKEERVTYSGNEAAAIDPFMFFPDPRVPMNEVNKRGEFVFWRSFDGKHTLLRAEAAGELKHVQHAGQMPSSRGANDGNSSRSLAANGTAQPGRDTADAKTKNYIQVDQGTVDIIPRELGLGTSNKVERWLFTILNKKQIVQAEKLDNDHGMHPVVVSEPYSQGYGFGHLGLSDYLAPTQDTLSWLINSHMDNVKNVLNDMLIVNPNMIEMQDITNPGPGRLIRLKSTFPGGDVRQAVSQLNIHDVTQNHLQDFALFMRMGDVLSSVNDNIRGLQTTGGRKTATEVRTSAEAASSRLASHAQHISSQALVDLASQFSLNTQQYLDEDFYIDIVGEKGKEAPIHITPEMLVGDFHYPVNDGTLPMDKVAMLDVWKEIFLGVAGDEQLRQQFDITEIFTHVAELGGAKNIDQFKIQMTSMPDGQLAGQAEAGNVVPIGGGGQTPGVVSSPGDRLAGAL
jgi:hypothetical protein